jgi:hypothetical protein
MSTHQHMSGYSALLHITTRCLSSRVDEQQPQVTSILIFHVIGVSVLMTPIQTDSVHDYTNAHNELLLIVATIR